MVPESSETLTLTVVGIQCGLKSKVPSLEAAPASSLLTVYVAGPGLFCARSETGRVKSRARRAG